MTRNVAYAAIAPFARLVPPGSVRIGTVTSASGLPAVAFRTPAGVDVMVFANPGATVGMVDLVDRAEPVSPAIPAGAVLAVRW